MWSDCRLDSNIHLRVQTKKGRGIFDSFACTAHSWLVFRNTVVRTTILSNIRTPTAPSYVSSFEARPTPNLYSAASLATVINGHRTTPAGRYGVNQHHHTDRLARIQAATRAEGGQEASFKSSVNGRETECGITMHLGEVHEDSVFKLVWEKVWNFWTPLYRRECLYVTGKSANKRKGRKGKEKEENKRVKMKEPKIRREKNKVEKN